MASLTRWRVLAPLALAQLGRGSVGLGMALGLACGGGAAELMNSTSGDPVEVPPWACVPGENRACDCPDELPGIQTCNAEGSAFGDCDCSPGAVSQGPPPTSTGTGTGSDSGTGDTGSDTGPEPTTDDPTTMGPGSTTDPDPSTTGGTSTGPGPGSTGGGSSSTG